MLVMLSDATGRVCYTQSGAGTVSTSNSVRFNQSIIFFSNTKSAPTTSYQPTNSVFLLQQISTSHSQPNRVSPSVRVNGLTKRGHGTANSPVSHYFICILWPEQLIACLIQLWRRRRRFSSSGRRPRCCWRLGRGDDFETACHDPIILCAAS